MKKATTKTGASFHRGSSNQEWKTPPEVIAAVEKRFGRIIFDLAANNENAVCGTYWSKEDDALSLDWCQQLPTGNLWLNPPFEDIAPWAARAAKCWKRKGFLFLLIPASIDANWFEDFVRPYSYVMPVAPRIKFIGAKDPYPKPIAMAAFGWEIVGAAAPFRWKDRPERTTRRLEVNQ